MALRRMDNRARFRDSYYNNIIDKINQLNKLRFTMGGNRIPGGVGIGGTVSQSPVYEFSDHKYFCPPFMQIRPDGVWYMDFLLYRDALPTWGATLANARSAHAKANSVKYYARDDFYDYSLEMNGYGKYDLTGVSAEDYLIGGEYPYAGSEHLGYATADVYAGYSAVTNPAPSPDGRFTKYNITNWIDVRQYTCGGNPVYFGTDPEWGLLWHCKHCDGVASVFPKDPDAWIGGNYVFSNDQLFGGSNAGISVQSQSFGFPHLLDRLPDGAKITRALLAVKIGGLSHTAWSETTEVEFNPATNKFDVNTQMEESTEEYASLSLVLMGRVKSGVFTDVYGIKKMFTDWEVVGELPARVVESGKYAIADFTELFNSYLTDLRAQNKYMDFCLFPAEYVGFAGGDALKGYLYGLCGKPSFAICENPNWDLGGISDVKDHGNFFWDEIHDDLMFIPARNGFSTSWSSVAFGEGVLEYTLPTSEFGKTISFRNIVRGDSPIIL